MSINNKLLKNSMNECFDNFIDYHTLINSQLKSLLQFLKNQDDHTIYEKITKYEDESDVMYRKNQENVNGYISQQTPIGSNLRFFLAIHQSLKDLERSGDYIHSIARMIYKNKLLKCFDQFCDGTNIGKQAINKMDEMGAIFIKHPKKISTDDFETIKSIKSNLFVEFKSNFKKTNLEILEQIKKGGEEDLTNLSYTYGLILKIERTVDHIFNVIANFYFKDNA